LFAGGQAGAEHRRFKGQLKEKQEPNERDAFLKELEEAFGVASKELGYKDPTEVVK
jgi:hypothetical protein